MLTDGALLERYARYRDADAFAELANRYAGLVYSACLRITGNSADAEDVAQECFLELARNAAAIRSSIPGWLHRVAKNKAANAVRKANISRQREEEAAELNRSGEEPGWREIAAYVDEAIERLPESIRLTLILHYLQGKTQDEVARELGISQATVSRMLDRGIEGMRKYLRKLGLTVPVSLLAGMLVENSSSAVPAGVTAAIGKMAMSGIGSSAAPVAAGGAIASISAFLGTVVGKSVAVTGAAIVVAGAGTCIHEMQGFSGSAASAVACETDEDTSSVTVDLIADALRNQEAACGYSLELEYTFDWRKTVSSGPSEATRDKYRYVRTPDALRVECEKENDIVVTSSYDRVSKESIEIWEYPHSQSMWSTGRIDHIVPHYLSKQDMLETARYPLYEGPLCDVIANGTVSAETEEIDGQQCIRVDVPTSKRTLKEYRVWVDQTIGFNPRRIEFVWKDKSPTVVSFQSYEEIDTDIWFPMTQTLSYVSRNEPGVNFTVNTVTKIQHGRSIPKQDVLVTPPSGTVVQGPDTEYIVP